MSDNFNYETSFAPEPEEPQTASSAGAGMGPRRPTSIGNSDGAGGGEDKFYGYIDDNSVPHQQLKDLAIDALESSRNKDYMSISSVLIGAVMRRGLGEAQNISEVLSSLVVTAYTTASFLPNEDAFVTLKKAFPHFTSNQLCRIVRIARSRRS